ncbi:MAG: stage 0 sporulation family protein [Clostridia bacterium]|jgi:cell fate regulator YaaT (PSP1 superfamily)|nr:stage 0 sporulation family protein [Clostridia bacterium]
MAKVVVIKFRNGSKPYYFSAGNTTPQRGQGVIVETARGIEYATVLIPEQEVDDSKLVAPLKPILRIATAADEETVKKNEERKGEAIRIAKERIRKHALEMKLIDCEFTLDGTKVIFTFTAEGRVDFRELVKDLASVFHIRIELKQVGIRDESRILGGIAPCGRSCCCSGCMPEFKKVSIKMAKNQGLSLNPGKISGLCGRLMCCLAYENDYYSTAYKKMPKVGGAVSSPEGKGTVIAVNMLKMTARVKIEKDGAVVYRDFSVDDLGFKRAESEEEVQEPVEE